MKLQAKRKKRRLRSGANRASFDGNDQRKGDSWADYRQSRIALGSGLVLVEIVVIWRRRIGAAEAVYFASVDSRQLGTILDDGDYHHFRQGHR